MRSEIKVRIAKNKIFFTYVVVSLVVFVAMIVNPFFIRHENVIMGDGWHLYSYLPNFFIEQNYYYSNKYPIGVALIEFPFFIAAKILSFLFSVNERGGYNKLFQFSILCCAFFHYYLGSFFIYKTLVKLQDRIASCVTIATLTFGTPLFCYVTNYASYSHIYSFAYISLFLYLMVTEKFITDRQNFLIGFVIGLITIIRNQNALIAFGVFIYLLSDMNKIGLFMRPKSIFAKTIGLIIPLGLQMVVWKVSTGHFLVYSYKGESFLYWNNPKIFEVLFSDAKGVFIFSPILVFSILGFFCLKNSEEKRISAWILFVLFFFVYFTGSWWCWWLGVCPGIRTVVDILPFLAITMNAFYSFVFKMDKRKRIDVLFIFFILLSFVFLFINLRIVYEQGRGRINSNLANYDELKSVFFPKSSSLNDKFYARNYNINNDVYFYNGDDVPKNALSCDAYVKKGFEIGDYNSVNWTVGDELCMLFSFSDVLQNSKVYARFELGTVYNTKQRITVFQNEKQVYKGFVFNNDEIFFTFTVPSDGFVKIIFNIPDCISPYDLLGEPDARKLGFQIKKCTFSSEPNVKAGIYSMNDYIYFHRGDDVPENAVFADSFVRNGFEIGDYNTLNWTNGEKFSMYMNVSEKSIDMHKRINAMFYLGDIFNNIQVVYIYINGKKIGKKEICNNDKLEFSFYHPNESFIEIVFIIPTAISPAKLGINGDGRRLGFQLDKAVFYQNR